MPEVSPSEAYRQVASPALCQVMPAPLSSSVDHFLDLAAVTADSDEEEEISDDEPRFKPTAMQQTQNAPQVHGAKAHLLADLADIALRYEERAADPSSSSSSAVPSSSRPSASLTSAETLHLQTLRNRIWLRKIMTLGRLITGRRATERTNAPLELWLRTLIGRWSATRLNSMVRPTKFAGAFPAFTRIIPASLSTSLMRGCCPAFRTTKNSGAYTSSSTLTPTHPEKVFPPTNARCRELTGQPWSMWRNSSPQSFLRSALPPAAASWTYRNVLPVFVRAKRITSTWLIVGLLFAGGAYAGDVGFAVQGDLYYDVLLVPRVIVDARALEYGYELNAKREARVSRPSEDRSRGSAHQKDLEKDLKKWGRRGLRPRARLLDSSQLSLRKKTPVKDLKFYNNVIEVAQKMFRRGPPGAPLQARLPQTGRLHSHQSEDRLPRFEISSYQQTFPASFGRLAS
ncbi:hypothetical protein BDZ89DRAFT_1221390 [Hymenopellis radicata]|nr:hypothetical protein BDZ89DRAFT_1221390 [Hymenopellis radicata]